MNIKYHVIVVGCGGTGSFFIKEFARFLSTTTHEIYLTLIDGDTVEAQNLDRQAFQEEDIGERYILQRRVSVSTLALQSFD